MLMMSRGNQFAKVTKKLKEEVVNMKKRNRVVALFSALMITLSTLSVPAFAMSVNEDVVGTDFEVAVGKLKAVGVMQGYPDGSFKPEGNITRAEFAKIAVEAMGLGEAAEASKGTNTKFPDVPGDKWYSGYVNVAVNRGLINGYPDGTYKPNGNLKNSEALTILVRMVGLGPVVDKEGRWPSNYIGRAANEGILDEVFVAGNATATRGNVAKMLSNSLSVEMWGASGYEDDGSVNYGKISPAETLLKDRLEIIEKEEVRVTAYDTEENELTVDGNTYEIAKDVDVDLYEAYLNEVTIWTNEDDEIIFLTVESDYFIDAIEINSKNDEVKLLSTGKKYDLDLTDSDVNGSGSVSADTTYDLAKVVLNDKNDVAYIDAYTWSDFYVVKSSENDLITNIDDDELDTDDFTIFKDGKLIDSTDVAKDDILFFNTTGDGFAEVYNKSVSGNINHIYSDAFDVAGNDYDFAKSTTADLNAKYIDKDGDLENYDDDAAEQMKNEDITIYLDREGEATFVTGKLGNVTTNSSAGILIENTKYDQTFNKYSLQFKYINEAGKEMTKTVAVEDLEKITLDGKEYETGKNHPDVSTEIDKFGLADVDTDSDLDITTLDSSGSVINTTKLGELKTGPDTWLSKETVVVFTYDNNGNVVELEFFNSNSIALDNGGSTNLDIKDDKYAENKQLKSNTVIFNIEDGLEEGDTTVAELNKVTSYDEIVDQQAELFANKDNEIVYIVAKQTDAEEDESDYTALLVSSRTNTDGEVVKLTAWVDGNEKTYEVDELSTSLTDGKAYTLTINDKNGKVTAIAAITPAANELDEVITANTVSVSDKEFTIGAGRTYKLVSDATILDRTKSDPEDIKVKAIRDLRDLGANNKVTIILDQASTNFVKMVIITDKDTTDAGDSSY
jgi:hypothetical protein